MPADVYTALSTIPLERILLGVGVLIAASVGTSKMAGRLGVPALVLFLGVGMLAGSDGPGGIYFDDPWVAQFLGTTALVVILFAGGLDTDWRGVRPVVGPAILLSTLGVAVTAGVVGLFVAWVLRVPPLEALLLGSVISSTDAAAVFSVLRSRRAALKGRLRPLLELESASNDPMAVLLTVGFIQVLTRPGGQVVDLLPMFVLQMGIGGVLGYALGRLCVVALNRVRLEYDGLYPVLALAMVLSVYGVVAAVGGSGFLAVYLAGLVIGNSDAAHRRSLMRFYDSQAWLMQIMMFVTLGLLVFPSEIPKVIGPGLAVAAVLMLVARPVAVFAILSPFRVSLREMALVSWVGLRGAVPIVLSTWPRVAGVPSAQWIFNMVFFVVLTSALLQGTSIAGVARWLGVAATAPDRPRAPLEWAPSARTRNDLVEMAVPSGSPAAGVAIRELGLPRETLVVLISRDGEYLVPAGGTVVEAGDTLLLLGDRDGLDAARARILGDLEGAQA